MNWKRRGLKVYLGRTEQNHKTDPSVYLDVGLRRFWVGVGGTGGHGGEPTDSIKKKGITRSIEQLLATTK